MPIDLDIQLIIYFKFDLRGFTILHNSSIERIHYKLHIFLASPDFYLSPCPLRSTPLHKQKPIIFVIPIYISRNNQTKITKNIFGEEEDLGIKPRIFFLAAFAAGRHRFSLFKKFSQVCCNFFFGQSSSSKQADNSS